MKVLYFKSEKSSLCKNVDKLLKQITDKPIYKDVEVITIDCSKKDTLKDKLKVTMVPTFIQVSKDKKPKELKRIVGVDVLIKLETFLKP